MNLYWCYNRDDLYGIYVAAENRNKAKIYAMIEMDIDYIDVNVRCFKKDVEELSGRIITCSDFDSRLRYNLNYDCEECEFKFDCIFLN